MFCKNIRRSLYFPGKWNVLKGRDIQIGSPSWPHQALGHVGQVECRSLVSLKPRAVKPQRAAQREISGWSSTLLPWTSPKCKVIQKGGWRKCWWLAPKVTLVSCELATRLQGKVGKFQNKSVCPHPIILISTTKSPQSNKIYKFPLISYVSVCSRVVVSSPKYLLGWFEKPPGESSFLLRPVRAWPKHGSLCQSVLANSCEIDSSAPR